MVENEKNEGCRPCSDDASTTDLCLGHSRSVELVGKTTSSAPETPPLPTFDHTGKTGVSTEAITHALGKAPTRISTLDITKK